MARRGEGPGCAAAGEVEGGEDRGCGLGFESQPHRHCSRAPSAEGSQVQLVVYVRGAGRAGGTDTDGQTDIRTAKGGEVARPAL